MTDYNHLLAGKRAFITTGIRGMGKAIAVIFAKQGAKVAVGGKNMKLAESTDRELKAINTENCVIPCNLSYKEEIETVCDSLIKKWGGIDILVNTVGVNHRDEITNLTDEDLLSLYETNYLSGIRCIRKFIPGMVERKYGVIINISSIHSELTMPGYVAYAGTKGAVNASSRAMALDYADKGIRINNICPGLILSDNVMDEINSYPKGEERNRIMGQFNNMQPLAPGKMEDIANVALFLASDMSSYITGQSIMVDGGASIKAHP